MILVLYRSGGTGSVKRYVYLEHNNRTDITPVGKDLATWENDIIVRGAMAYGGVRRDQSGKPLNAESLYVGKHLELKGMFNGGILLFNLHLCQV